MATLGNVDLSPEWRKAMRGMCDLLQGNQSELARYLEVDKSQIGRWLGDNPTGMKAMTYKNIKDKVDYFLDTGKLLPSFKLKQYLPTDYASKPSPSTFPPPPRPPEEHGNATPVSEGEFVPRPCVGMAQAATWDCASTPFDEFATDCGELVPVPRAWGGYHVFRCEGSSMEPWFPDGSYLIVDLDSMPQHGQAIICKLRDTQSVVFKVYAKTDDGFELLSINGDECHWNGSFKGSLAYHTEWRGIVADTFRPERKIWQKMKDSNQLDTFIEALRLKSAERRKAAHAKVEEDTKGDLEGVQLCPRAPV